MNKGLNFLQQGMVKCYIMVQYAAFRNLRTHKFVDLKQVIRQHQINGLKQESGIGKDSLSKRPTVKGL